jgi:hypothetical protein
MAGTMTSEERRLWAAAAIGLALVAASLQARPTPLIAVAIGLVVLVAPDDWLPRHEPPRRALPQDPRRSPLFDRELDGLP